MGLHLHYYSFGYRLLLASLPSMLSAITCLLAAAAIVGGCILAESLNIGTLLPGLFEGEWGIIYTNAVVRPLALFFGSEILGVVAAALFWGIIGLLAYGIWESASVLFRKLRSARHQNLYALPSISEDPAFRNSLQAAAWRTLVAAIFFGVFIFFILPQITALQTAAPQIVLGASPLSELSAQVIAFLLVFIFICHLIVVLLRLFVMRVRLFGGPEY